MRWLLAVPILLYRVMPRRWKKRSCLFKETCSAYVLRILLSEGCIAGFAAFKARHKQCRGIVAVDFEAGASGSSGLRVHLLDGSTVSASAINEALLQPYLMAQKSG